MTTGTPIEVSPREVASGVVIELSGLGDDAAGPVALTFRSDVAALTASGDAALVAALPLALLAGRPLLVDAPVSRRLVASSDEIQDILRVWWRLPDRIPVQASGQMEAPPGSVHAGVDDGSVGAVHLAVADDAPDRLVRLVDRGTPPKAAPEAHGGPAADPVVIEHDGRRIADLAGLDWSRQYEGVVAIAAGHLMADLGRLDLAASFSVHYLFPWSSHPFLDRLWSSGRLTVRHRHGHLDWFERLRVVHAADPVALGRVDCCNDATCARCVLHAAALDVLDTRGSFDPERLPGIDVRHHADLARAAVFLRHVDRAAHAEVVGAVEAAIGRLGPADVQWPDNWMAHLAELGADRP